MSKSEQAAAQRIAAIREGGKVALARALADIERAGDHDDMVALLDAAYAEPGGHVVGVTGPPGVGKSSMLSALIQHLRAGGRSVGVIAIDPSSKRSKGALLGDRTRIVTDPDDQQVFIRSMAARDRLGGLAEITIDAAVLMRALFDVVLVETVGVGQSETDVAMLADTVLFCVQPASGDSLQFMKAGIMEIPDLAVVTKADLGAAAERTRIDVVSALKAAGRVRDGWKVRVLSIAAQPWRGDPGAGRGHRRACPAPTQRRPARDAAAGTGAGMAGRGDPRAFRARRHCAGETPFDPG